MGMPERMQEMKTSTPWEKLERLKVEADRWIAGVAGSPLDNTMLASASTGIRELLNQAACLSSEKGATASSGDAVKSLAAVLAEARSSETYRKEAAALAECHDKKLPCPTCPNPPSCAEYGSCQLRDDPPDSTRDKQETPRTDAELIEATFPNAEVVSAAFARQLEKELRGANAEWADAMQRLGEALSARGDIERDAARYRYIRNTAPWKSAAVAVMSCDVGDDIAMLTHDGLDAIIDNAMTQYVGEKK